MRWERELGDALRDLARTVEDVPANPDAEARLLEAFDARGRAGTHEGATLDAPRGARLQGGGVWYLAAAASLVLALGGWWAVSRSPQNGSSGPAAVAHTAAAPSPVPAADVPPGPLTEPPGRMASATPAAPPPRAASRPAPLAASQPVDTADSGEEADAVEFVELPAANQLPRFESGTIVRVELPVSSLPAYGLAIMPDAPRTPVTADVLVGQDGQPRAIRLVGYQTGPRRH